MPLLPAEPFVFPNDLLTNANPEGKTDGKWWALHTRPRAEKGLARKLLSRSIPFFLPLYKKQYRCSGRMVKAYLPLFPGYLFFCGGEQERIHALESNLVCRTLPVENQTQLLADLGQVFRLMESGFALTPEQKLQPGTLVDIISGPLMGIQGKVLCHSKKTKIFVEIQFLQSAVSVEVESETIRPLPGSRSESGLN